MSEQFGEDIPPTPNQGEKYKREPELQVAYDLLNHYKSYQVEKLNSTSKTERQGAANEIAERETMASILRSIETATKRPNNKKTWREHLDHMHSSSSFWEKQLEKAKTNGERSEDLVFRQMKAVDRFYGSLTPEALAQHRKFMETTKQSVIHKEASSETVDPELEVIVEDTYRKGRVALHASISTDFARSRNLYSGFQTVVDKRSVGIGDLRNSTAEINYAFETSTLRDLMKKSDITTAITIEQVKVRNTGNPQTIAMSRYTGDSSDTKPAYRVTYVVEALDPIKNPPKEFQYRDPATNRHGNELIAVIHAPNEVAEKAFNMMQKNRVIALKFLEKFDPEFVADQKDYFPDDHGTFVLPEGMADQAYDRNQNGIPQKIRLEFIK